MDHGDPAPQGAPRRPRFDTLSEYLDVSSIGVMLAAEDLTQRRLAGAVLSDQRVNLALSNIEIDAISHDRRAETLDDALETNRRLLRRGIAPGLRSRPKNQGRTAYLGPLPRQMPPGDVERRLVVARNLCGSGR